MKKFDVVIHGAGMIGQACALGLSQLGYSVALIDAQSEPSFDPSVSSSVRVSALNLSSELLLDQLGAWSWIKQQRGCQYQGLEALETEGNSVLFQAQDIGMPYLGHILENDVIQMGLYRIIEQSKNIEIYFETTISNIDWQPTNTTITVANGDVLEAGWVVGADGINSKVRHFADIGVTGWDYDQHACVISIRSEKKQPPITWQRFTPTGPQAYLPLYEQQGSLVWYHSPSEVKRLKSLPHAKLQQKIYAEFPKRLEKFTIEQVASFPLSRRHAQSYCAPQCVLVGDAAHSIHPLAGQGVNLGFKDIKALLDGLKKHEGKPFQQRFSNACQDYQTSRYRDNLLMMTAMDTFHVGFQSSMPILKHIRHAGMFCAQRSGPLKKQVLKYALGL